MKNILKMTEEEKRTILEMHNKEKNIYEQEYKDSYLDVNIIKPLLDKGYTIVDKFPFLDGPYFLKGKGYTFRLYNVRDVDLKHIIITVNGVKGVNETQIPIMVKNGEVVDFFEGVYKILKQP